MRITKWLVTISLLCGMAMLYSRCIDSSQRLLADVRGKEYAGSTSCKNCHKNVYRIHQQDVHSQTSWPVANMPTDILPVNVSFVFNAQATVTIEKRDSGFYQVARINGKDSIAKRFDIGFGSGDNAYTFGYWQDKKVYQLPLSFFRSINGWANSPGFPAQHAYFQRPIIRRCFECHSSYIGEDLEQAQSLTQVRQLDQSSVIFGIDCERCHGPGAAHVAFQEENPSSKEAKFISRWSSLSRQQKLDACSVCHSGNDLTTQRSTFDFKPGDTLANFFYPEFSATSSDLPDVHGRQAQLLAASRCFQMSNTLECTSCHNTHNEKFKTLNDYSKQCSSCHKEVNHREVALPITNCIDCHMPREASRLISFQVMEKQKVDSYLLRTHRIAIYSRK